jgi:hypothetical protein
MVAALFCAAPSQLIASASAAKSIGGFIGGPSSGSLGGLFNQPRDVAVSQVGAGAADAGDMYVADASNQRIVVLDANGDFKFAFGRDVVVEGGVGDTATDLFEKCTVAADCKVGVTGGGGGQLNAPQGVAINQATGDVFVREPSGTNRRVQQFDAAGSFVRAWGFNVVIEGTSGDTPTDQFEVCAVAADCQSASALGSNAGQFGSSSTNGGGIAVSPVNGHVLVGDPGNRRVMQFDPGAALPADVFVRAFGWGVDSGPTGGAGANTAFEVCTSASGCAGGSTTAGAENGRFGSNSPVHLAVDSQNVVYAADAATGTVANRVVRIDLDLAPASGTATAALLDPINPTTGAGPSNVLFASGTTPTVGLEIDPDTDAGGADEESLLVTRDPASGNTIVQELDIPTDTGAGELPTDAVTVVDTHTFAAATPNGLGINPTTENLYLPGPYTGAGQPGHGMFVLVQTPGPFSNATLGAVSAIGTTSATLTGALDPNVGVASYLFEVSSDGVTFNPVGHKRYVTGSGSTPLSANATGLEPNSSYRARLTAVKQTGLTTATTITTPETVFLTDAAAPDATTLGSANRTSNSAELRASIDPNGSPTTYRFEWGPDGGSFDNQAPIPDGNAGSGNTPIMVTQTITGLLPETDYHYRIVATNPSGTTVGSAVSFTTERTTTATPSDGRAYELVTPAQKVGTVGVGTWYEGPGSLGGAGFPAQVGERFAAQSLQGGILLDSAQGYANDWAFADRIDDETGWQSHSPFSHGADAQAFAQFLQPNHASEDLATLTWDTNNSTTKIFPELTAPLFNDFIVPFVTDWGGMQAQTRWELFGPTASSDLASDANTIGGAVRRLWEFAVSGDGSRVVGAAAATDSGQSGIRGLAGPGDPTDAGFADLVSGRSIYAADTEGPLADDFAGTGTRELVNVCTGTIGSDRTELPTVSGGGDMTAEECPDALPGRDSRLVSDRGATLAPQDVDDDGSNFTGALDNVVSVDGSRTFFLSPDPQAAGVPDGVASFCQSAGTTCPAQLYVREDGETGTTVRWISRAAPGLFGNQDASLTGTVRFESATPDGDKVFFRTNSPLTPDDPNGGAPVPGGVTTGTASNSSWDLYVYDFPDVPGSDPGDGTLARVSAGPDGTGDCNSPVGGGAVGSGTTGPANALRFASEDGMRAYFACAAPLPDVPVPSNGTITSPQGTPSNTATVNLYMYDAERAPADRWTFVASVPRSTSTATVASCASTGSNAMSPLISSAGFEIGFAGSTFNCVRGTADGRFMTFWSAGRLTPDDPVSPATADIYAYDAALDELTRITAPQGGVGGTYPCGNVGAAAAQPCFGDLGVDGVTDTTLRPPAPNLTVATQPLEPDDRVAFFQSRSRLVAADTDAAYDVYQWRNGSLSLVSTGQSDANDGAVYKGNDSSGRNVYFATRDALTWQDVDGIADIYTARIDGGIPEPPPPTVCVVLADGCQGPGAAPAAPVPSATDAPGSGNVDESERKTLSVANPSARARRAAARTGVLAIRVRTNDAGPIRATARGRIRRRMRMLGSGSTRLADAGSATLRLRLGGAARTALREGRTLRLAIQVRAPGARPQLLNVTLRRAGR